MDWSYTNTKSSISTGSATDLYHRYFTDIDGSSQDFEYTSSYYDGAISKYYQSEDRTNRYPKIVMGPVQCPTFYEGRLIEFQGFDRNPKRSFEKYYYMGVLKMVDAPKKNICRVNRQPSYVNYFPGRYSPGYDSEETDYYGDNSDEHYYTKSTDSDYSSVSADNYSLGYTENTSRDYLDEGAYYPNDNEDLESSDDNDGGEFENNELITDNIRDSLSYRRKQASGPKEERESRENDNMNETGYNNSEEETVLVEAVKHSNVNIENDKAEEKRKVNTKNDIKFIRGVFERLNEILFEEECTLHEYKNEKGKVKATKQVLVEGVSIYKSNGFCKCRKHCGITTKSRKGNEKLPGSSQPSPLKSIVPEPELGSESESEPKLEPEPKLGPESESEPELEPELGPEPEAELKPEPQPAPDIGKTMNSDEESKVSALETKSLRNISENEKRDRKSKRPGTCKWTSKCFSTRSGTVAKSQMKEDGKFPEPSQPSVPKTPKQEIQRNAREANDYSDEFQGNENLELCNCRPRASDKGTTVNKNEEGKVSATETKSLGIFSENDETERESKRLFSENDETERETKRLFSENEETERKSQRPGTYKRTSKCFTTRSGTVTKSQKEDGKLPEPSQPSVPKSPKQELQRNTRKANDYSNEFQGNENLELCNCRPRVSDKGATMNKNEEGKVSATETKSLEKFSENEETERESKRPFSENEETERKSKRPGTCKWTSKCFSTRSGTVTKIEKEGKFPEPSQPSVPKTPKQKIQRNAREANDYSDEFQANENLELCNCLPRVSDKGTTMNKNEEGKVSATETKSLENFSENEETERESKRPFSENEETERKSKRPDTCKRTSKCFSTRSGTVTKSQKEDGKFPEPSQPSVPKSSKQELKRNARKANDYSNEFLGNENLELCNCRPRVSDKGATMNKNEEVKVSATETKSLGNFSENEETERESKRPFSENEETERKSKRPGTCKWTSKCFSTRSDTVTKSQKEDGKFPEPSQPSVPKSPKQELQRNASKANDNSDDFRGNENLELCNCPPRVSEIGTIINKNKEGKVSGTETKSLRNSSKNEETDREFKRPGTCKCSCKCSPTHPDNVTNSQQEYGTLPDPSPPSSLKSPKQEIQRNARKAKYYSGDSHDNENLELCNCRPMNSDIETIMKKNDEGNVSASETKQEIQRNTRKANDYSDDSEDNENLKLCNCRPRVSDIGTTMNKNEESKVSGSETKSLRNSSENEETERESKRPGTCRCSCKCSPTSPDIVTRSQKEYGKLPEPSQRSALKSAKREIQRNKRKSAKFHHDFQDKESDIDTTKQNSEVDISVQEIEEVKVTVSELTSMRNHSENEETGREFKRPGTCKCSCKCSPTHPDNVTNSQQEYGTPDPSPPSSVKSPKQEIQRNARKTNDYSDDSQNNENLKLCLCRPRVSDIGTIMNKNEEGMVSASETRSLRNFSENEETERESKRPGTCRCSCKCSPTSPDIETKSQKEYGKLPEPSQRSALKSANQEIQRNKRKSTKFHYDFLDKESDIDTTKQNSEDDISIQEVEEVKVTVSELTSMRNLSENENTERESNRLGTCRCSCKCSPTSSDIVTKSQQECGKLIDPSPPLSVKSPKQEIQSNARKANDYSYDSQDKENLELCNCRSRVSDIGTVMNKNEVGMVSVSETKSLRNFSENEETERESKRPGTCRCSCKCSPTSPDIETKSQKEYGKLPEPSQRSALKSANQEIQRNKRKSTKFHYDFLDKESDIDITKLNSEDDISVQEVEEVKVTVSELTAMRKHSANEETERESKNLGTCKCSPTQHPDMVTKTQQEYGILSEASQPLSLKSPKQEIQRNARKFSKFQNDFQDKESDIDKTKQNSEDISVQEIEEVKVTVSELTSMRNHSENEETDRESKRPGTCKCTCKCSPTRPDIGTKSQQEYGKLPEPSQSSIVKSPEHDYSDDFQENENLELCNCRPRVPDIGTIMNKNDEGKVSHSEIKTLRIFSENEGTEREFKRPGSCKCTCKCLPTYPDIVTKSQQEYGNLSEPSQPSSLKSPKQEIQRNARKANDYSDDSQGKEPNVGTIKQKSVEESTVQENKEVKKREEQKPVTNISENEETDRESKRLGTCKCTCNCSLIHPDIVTKGEKDIGKIIPKLLEETAIQENEEVKVREELKAVTNLSENEITDPPAHPGIVTQDQKEYGKLPEPSQPPSLKSPEQEIQRNAKFSHDFQDKEPEIDTIKQKSVEDISIREKEEIRVWVTDFKSVRFLSENEKTEEESTRLCTCKSCPTGPGIVVISQKEYVNLPRPSQPSPLESLGQEIQITVRKANNFSDDSQDMKNLDMRKYPHTPPDIVIVNQKVKLPPQPPTPQQEIQITPPPPIAPSEPMIKKTKQSSEIQTDQKIEPKNNYMIITENSNHEIQVLFNSEPANKDKLMDLSIAKQKYLMIQDDSNEPKIVPMEELKLPLKSDDTFQIETTDSNGKIRQFQSRDNAKTKGFLIMTTYLDKKIFALEEVNCKNPSKKYDKFGSIKKTARSKKGSRESKVSLRQYNHGGEYFVLVSVGSHIECYQNKETNENNTLDLKRPNFLKIRSKFGEEIVALEKRSRQNANKNHEETKYLYVNFDSKVKLIGMQDLSNPSKNLLVISANNEYTIIPLENNVSPEESTHIIDSAKSEEEMFVKKIEINSSCSIQSGVCKTTSVVITKTNSASCGSQKSLHKMLSECTSMDLKQIIDELGSKSCGSSKLSNQKITKNVSTRTPGLGKKSLTRKKSRKRSGQSLIIKCTKEHVAKTCGQGVQSEISDVNKTISQSCEEMSCSNQNISLPHFVYETTSNASNTIEYKCGFEITPDMEKRLIQLKVADNVKIDTSNKSNFGSRTKKKHIRETKNVSRKDVKGRIDKNLNASELSKGQKTSSTNMSPESEPKIRTTGSSVHGIVKKNSQLENLNKTKKSIRTTPPTKKRPENEAQIRPAGSSIHGIVKKIIGATDKKSNLSKRDSVSDITDDSQSTTSSDRSAKNKTRKRKTTKRDSVSDITDDSQSSSSSDSSAKNKIRNRKTASDHSVSDITEDSQSITSSDKGAKNEKRKRTTAKPVYVGDISSDTQSITSIIKGGKNEKRKIRTAKPSFVGEINDDTQSITSSIKGGKKEKRKRKNAKSDYVGDNSSTSPVITSTVKIGKNKKKKRRLAKPDFVGDIYIDGQKRKKKTAKLKGKSSHKLFKGPKSKAGKNKSKFKIGTSASSEIPTILKAGPSSKSNYFLRNTVNTVQTEFDAFKKKRPSTSSHDDYESSSSSSDEIIARTESNGNNQENNVSNVPLESIKKTHQNKLKRSKSEDKFKENLHSENYLSSTNSIVLRVATNVNFDENDGAQSKTLEKTSSTKIKKVSSGKDQRITDFFKRKFKIKKPTKKKSKQKLPKGIVKLDNSNQTQTSSEDKNTEPEQTSQDTNQTTHTEKSVQNSDSDDSSTSIKSRSVKTTHTCACKPLKESSSSSPKLKQSLPDIDISRSKNHRLNKSSHSICSKINLVCTNKDLLFWEQIFGPECKAIGKCKCTPKTWDFIRQPEVLSIIIFALLMLINGLIKIIFMSVQAL